ncbi:MAG TPA: sulfatase [Dongiaceae bacterium]|nr:sulfatase [Dongiaceae bacterium]
MSGARRARTGAALIALAALVAVGAACGFLSRRAKPPDIILIVVDTLRADHLGAYGYRRPTTPRLDALAATGTRFESATSAAPWTLPSIMSILTSRLPSRHGVIDDGLRLPADIPTLASTLETAGYRTGGFVAHIYVTAPFGFDRGFGHFEDFGLTKPGYARERGLEPTADKVTDGALAWVAGDPDAPIFLLVHYFDPHWPYDPPASYRDRFASTPPYAGPLDASYDSLSKFQEPSAPMPDDYRRFLIDRYDGEIAFVDAEIGRLVDGVRKTRAGRPLAIVVTGDHGEEFKEHGSVGHGRQMYEEVLHVPLILAPPARAGAAVKIAEPVSSLDIAPTLLALAGATPPPGMQGHSLLPLLQPDGARAAATPAPVSETVRLGAIRQAVRSGPLKLIHSMDEDHAELYNLASDPNETRNLASTRPDDRRRLTVILFERGDHLSGAWNLVWSGDGRPHRFEGRIETKGIIRSVVPPGTTDAAYRLETPAVLVFSDPAARGESGLSFTTLPYEAPVTFQLLVDGRPLPDAVRLGGAAARPRAMPFTMEGAPDAAPAFARPPAEAPPVPRFLLWRTRPATAEEPAVLDEELRARLKSLGYVQ